MEQPEDSLQRNKHKRDNREEELQQLHERLLCDVCKLPDDSHSSSLARTPPRCKAHHPGIHTCNKRIHASFYHTLVANMLKLLHVIAFVAEFAALVAKTTVLVALADTRILAEWHHAAFAVLRCHAYSIPRQHLSEMKES